MQIIPIYHIPFYMIETEEAREIFPVELTELSVFLDECWFPLRLCDSYHERKFGREVWS